MRYFTLLIMLLSVRAQAGGTVVGNGGDPIFEFMEAARSSMIETIKVIMSDPAEQAKFCEVASLTHEQSEFCRSYFSEIASNVLRLSQGLQKTPFVLKEEPLFVTGPDGAPMQVAARTELGAAGAIELHRDSVKTLLPTQALFLIMHEFEHKVSYFGRYVTDNDPIGPFARGRDLLDSVATSLVTVARHKGKIGTQFGVRDIFDCTASTGADRLGARLSSSRSFTAEDLMSYETSIGKNPVDGSIYLPETQDSSLALRLEITEPNNCGDPNPARQTSVAIVRSTKLPGGTVREEVLASQNLGTNPMCPPRRSQTGDLLAERDVFVRVLWLDGDDVVPISLRSSARLVQRHHGRKPIVADQFCTP